MATSESHINWAIRNSGYAFWSAMEQVASTALPRLVLFPVAAYFMGKEQFGLFMTALSVTLIIGTQPQSGLSDGLLKHLSDYPEEQRNQLCGTALRLSHRVVTAIVVIGILAVFGSAALKPSLHTLLSCMFPLIISLYPENQFSLTLTKTRYTRQFRHRTLWVFLKALSVLIFGIAGALIDKARGLAWGYMLGNSLAYIVIRLRHQSSYRPPYNFEMAKVLKSVWLQMSLASMLAVCGPYINRIFLGIYYSYGDVAELVAATSVMFIFLTPVGCSSIFLMSMISKYKSISQCSRRAKAAWLLVMFLGVVILPVMLFVAGDFVIKLLFPTFGEGPLRLLHILNWVVAFQTVISLTRPLVIKFGSIRIIPVINAISAAIMLLSAYLMIPRYGAAGAAWAVAVSNIITALLWVIFAGRVFVVRQSP